MLAVNEEFFSIQGEGELTGTPMYFVRLQGCAVGCHFCDTKQSWKKGEDTTNEDAIVKRAKDSGAKWLCITGGEPCEQDIRYLVKSAHDEKLMVSIETSGSVFDNTLHNIDHVVLSPKDLFTQEKYHCKEEALRCAHEIKCVVTQAKDIAFYIDRFESFAGVKSFQPMSNEKSIMCLLMEYLKQLTEMGWKIRCQQQTVFQIR